MPKIEVNKVAEILKRNELEPAVMRAIIEEMNALTQPEVDEEKPPPVKKQWCILISDPEGTLPENDLTGWVLQIPENESVLTTQERIHKAAYEFNTTKKGRMLPAETMGDAIENIPAKHFKEQQVWVKSKTPVLMLRTDNEIPMEKSDKDTRRRKGDV
ncbi:hypothetical protein Ga0100231_013300 [Opitutaceae bacterium TAV4]|uniref:hypothetical protein n=1 Tax=Geminisphaera colitermitum TaxID=1148786 RepID=UPI00019652F4|nr:hypothetical protein [Geminisphaera colitermitum]RRJ95135.1 hypothetical protein Ga0100231_013300 [Opitutaceae bacterium TAV4]RRJ99395.1 hypothetical protein Ga0100230_014605 [Opitutaceae bacterium TAV3]